MTDDHRCLTFSAVATPGGPSALRSFPPILGLRHGHIIVHKELGGGGSFRDIVNHGSSGGFPTTAAEPDAV